MAGETGVVKKEGIMSFWSTLLLVKKELSTKFDNGFYRPREQGPFYFMNLLANRDGLRAMLFTLAALDALRCK